jgi:hypothetical protein
VVQISRRPVEIAEQIVNNLMPLLDVLHDVAAGTDLGPGSKQRQVVEEAIKTLPAQLKYASFFAAIPCLHTVCACVCPLIYCN